MAEPDLITKIKETVSKKEAIGEADVRSLMIIVRKLLDLMKQPDSQAYLITRLFANWAVHIEITNSNTGLRILSAINDALVTHKSADTETLRKGISNEIGFLALRREMKHFLINFGVDDTIVTDNQAWVVFVNHLIEIIRDVPLSFPSLSTLDKAKRKIYDQIADNPIKAGAGVVEIQISNVDYSALGATDVGEIMCIIIRTEDTTSIVVPLLIEA